MCKFYFMFSITAKLKYNYELQRVDDKERCKILNINNNKQTAPFFVFILLFTRGKKTQVNLNINYLQVFRLQKVANIKKMQCVGMYSLPTALL